MIKNYEVGDYVRFLPPHIEEGGHKYNGGLIVALTITNVVYIQVQIDLKKKIIIKRKINELFK
jgi:hypothetical protein